ncbi:MAG: single-stranded-DNA-specific exonuclease RecJ [Oscillospiraceae bacterium]|nr:single-stranded-DNA-specific exonuclease RecJ [Oscillospiraceae bacterium]
MIYKDWKIGDYSRARARELTEAGLSPLLSAVLSARKMDIAAVRGLICTGALTTEDPMLMADMPKAVERINLALGRGEKIAVYGDYDVDGITASCLLVRYFRSRGAECELYIPDRIEEGYGISTYAVNILHERGVSLIVTVDCGVTAAAEARAAADLGMEMVITDHHECQGELPAAVAVVDPKRPDCPYPYKHLAGVGVAFKLVCAMEGPERINKLLQEYSTLVAMGTIADVMPVLGENRIFIRAGLSYAGSGSYPGLLALIKEAGFDARSLTCSNIGYSIAPRINAAGRMGRAMLAASLLLTQSEADAEAQARELCALNRERQRLEAETFAEASAMLEEGMIPEGPIVLASDSWYQGVVGIVASRLAERFFRPVAMVCLCNGVGRGSCRSFGDFNIFAALESSSELLEDFGGHALAAGFEVKEENLDALRSSLTKYYLKNGLPAAPVLDVDLEICEPALLSIENVLSLSSLEPYGHGNEQPLFCIRGAFLRSITPIGAGKHLKISAVVRGTPFECLFFSKTAAELGFSVGSTVDLAFRPQINEFKGVKNVQLLLKAVRKSSRDSYALGALEKHLLGLSVTDGEAAAILPDRQDLAAVWRQLASRCRDGAVRTERGALLSSLSESCRIPVGRVYIALEIFSEVDLIDFSDESGIIDISLSPSAQKADLSRSAVMAALKR